MEKIVLFSFQLKGYSLSHDQLALDMRLRCWLRVLKVEESKMSQLVHPQSIRGLISSAI